MFNDYKARLYLDVDGVLAVENMPDNAGPEWATAKVTFNRGGGYKESTSFTYSKDVVAQVDWLLNEYHVELVWASTWNENYDILKLPKGLGGLSGGRVLDAGRLNRAKDISTYDWTHWKAVKLLQDQTGDNLPFVWVDDEAITYHGSMVENSLPDVNKLFVKPQTLKGLTTESLVRMENFFKKL